MKLHREVIHPQTPDDLLIRLPESFLNTEVEVIVLSTGVKTHKRTFQDAQLFWKKHAVDGSALKRWTREELYD